MKKLMLASILGLSMISSSFAGESSLINDDQLYGPIKIETVHLTVFFKPSSSELSQANIDALGPKVMSYNPSKVYITGHTDADGKPEKNLALSNERVTSVKDYLVVQGLNSTTIQSAVGVGEGNPVCHEKTKVCKSNNRRVDIKLEYIKSEGK